MRVKVKETLAWLFLCSTVRGHMNAVPTAQMKGKLRKYERDEMPNAFERKKSIANGV